MTVKTEDRSAILDLLGRYCWLVDEGDADGWVALWTKDGKFIGGGPQPLEGHDQLRQTPIGFQAMGGGKLRHVLTNIVVDAGKTADEAIAKGYMAVYDLRPEGAGKTMIFLRSTYTLVRQGGAWKIKHLNSEPLYANMG
jgi:hypothetical protein